MGRPRKIKPNEEPIETLFNNPYVKEVIIRDPRFGYSRPAPKPSQTKKGRGKKEESEE
jgi:hypothetical protein